MKKILLLFLFFMIPAHTAFATKEETLILLDASVSMMQPLEETPKYILAINEAKKVLSHYDKTKAIGLRTIGISFENAMDLLSGDTESFCRATNLVAPINVNNINEINSKLDLVFPLGTTPLTYSLQQAIKNDFSMNSYKHIILITDGGESCNADPCSYIKEIMSSRNDIKIDVIAIGVTENELNELNCLTNATSGELHNVKTAEDLSSALNKFLDNSNLAKPFNNKSSSNKIIENIPKHFNEAQEIKYKNYLLVE